MSDRMCYMQSESIVHKRDRSITFYVNAMYQRRKADLVARAQEGGELAAALKIADNARFGRDRAP
jgi:hypothetical protein